jgi:hypothetical protein
MITEFEVLKTYSELLNGKYGEPGTVAQQVLNCHVKTSLKINLKMSYGIGIYKRRITTIIL